MVNEIKNSHHNDFGVYMDSTFLNRTLLASTISASLLLFGCGGGSDSSPSTGGGTPASTTISGTAAAGAPIVGSVTVKDANGATRTVDIAIDGSYQVDVTGMTAPFKFRASGDVGGRRVALVSAATSADIGGKINITPFTDLIVANIAGQLAQTYFDSSNSAALTASELNAARDTLTQRLLPILTSLGVASSFDLLHSAFAANHTGFDAVMDAVRVSIDPATSTATIQDIINNTKITDDLTSKTDSSVLPTPVNPLSAALPDILGIESTLTSFTALFANGLPADNATLRGHLVADGTFLDRGKNLDTFALLVSTEPWLKTLQVKELTLAPDSSNSATTKRIHLELGRAGVSGTWSTNWIMKKDSAGKWRIAGDQTPLDNDVIAINSRNLTSGSTVFSRELEFYVDYAPPVVEYLKITGPGLSVPAFYEHRVVTAGGSDLHIMDLAGNDTQENWVHECGTPQASTTMACIDFSLVPNDANFTFTPLDQNKAAIPTMPAYTRGLKRPPVSNADAMSHVSQWFGTITSITPSNYATLVNGSNITLSYIKPTDSLISLSDFGYYSNVESLYSSVPNADGQSVTVTWSGAAPTSTPTIGLWMEDSYNRHFLTLKPHTP